MVAGALAFLGCDGLASVDPAEAVKEYREAAEEGDAEAQSNLGVMYVKGQGVAQDDAEAVRWFRKAAEQDRGLPDFRRRGLHHRPEHPG